MIESSASCVIRKASSIADYAFLRVLRNEVRLRMTNNRGRIGVLQQLRFYLSPPPNLELYVAFVRGRRAGYLLLNRKPDTCMITEAVSDAFRRQGIGSQLIAFAKTRCDDLTADILVTNIPSIRLHEASGFVYQETVGEIATYRYKR